VEINKYVVFQRYNIEYSVSGAFTTIGLSMVCGGFLGLADKVGGRIWYIGGGVC